MSIDLLKNIYFVEITVISIETTKKVGYTLFTLYKGVTMPVLSIQLIKPLTTKEGKSLLVAALSAGLPLRTAGVSLKGESRSEKIALSSVELSALRKVARHHGEDDSDVASRLIADMHSRPSVLKASNVGLIRDIVSSKACNPNGMLRYNELQQNASNAVLDGLMGSKINLVEASTGSGKTIALLAAAASIPKEKRPVVVAVPAIALMDQVSSNWELIKKCMSEPPQIAYIIGKNNFVSEKSMRKEIARLKEETPDAEVITHAEAWLHDNSAHFKHGTSPKDMPYLTSSFTAMPELSDFPLSKIHGDTPNDDEGLIAYRSQFVRANSADIVVCTHAMVGIDIRMRQLFASAAMNSAMSKDEQIKAHKEASELSGEKIAFWKWKEEHKHEYAETFKLPSYKHIIIDEGHLFERSVASVMTDDLALNELRNLDIPKTNKNEIGNLLNQLMMLDSEDDIDVSTDHVALDLIIQMSSILKKTRKKDEHVKHALKMLESAIKNSKNGKYVVNISFSPIRKFPRLRTGLTSIYFHLKHLWDSVDSAVLLSGTIFLPSNFSESSNHLQLSLGIPRGRVVDVQLQTPTWHTDPVTIYTPEVNIVGGKQWLRPPKVVKGEDTNYQQELLKWCQDLALVIKNAHSTGAGGMLVLMTSYDAAHEMGRALYDIGLGDIIITADRDTGTKIQRDRFVTDSLKFRPIWVAVGASWTGLDLSAECQSSEDNLLTDLVIPRLPIGSNQTTTHAARRARFGWTFEVNETILFLRQGFGRLVRREGIESNRRLWLLDTRISEINGIKSLVRALVSKYKNQKVFCKKDI